MGMIRIDANYLASILINNATNILLYSFAIRFPNQTLPMFYSAAPLRGARGEFLLNSPCAFAHGYQPYKRSALFNPTTFAGEPNFFSYSIIQLFKIPNNYLILRIFATPAMTQRNS
jgi:hypothetical protein